MPTLEWIGKDKVINHHQEVPYRILDRKYSYDETGQHDGDNGSENKIIKGDNLEALKALLPEYEGKIKCIYIDPPYNTGNEGWVYNDNVSDPKIKKWLGEVVGKEGEGLSRHDKWLCMMYPRLKLLKKLLSKEGVIFISIDDSEQANLKLICDEIFGRTMFVACIPWRKRTAKVAWELSALDNIKWWHRNIAKKGFAINGDVPAYPDLIVLTTSGKILLIETKGDQLKNDESKIKAEIGAKWAAKASLTGRIYKYYMVFQKKDPDYDGACSYEKFMEIVREL